MIIYKTTNLITGKIYIGQDSMNNPNYMGSGIAIDNAFKKYGRSNFRKDILEYCISQEHLNEREIYWIACFKSDIKSIGYNLCKGGKGGRKGLKHTEQSIQKMRDAKKGCVISAEHRKKIKEALKGRKLPEERQKRVALANKGKNKGYKHTLVAKTNMSKAHVGKTLSDEQKKKISDSLIGNKYSLGYRHTQEHKDKVSRALKGRKYNKRIKEVTTWS